MSLIASLVFGCLVGAPQEPPAQPPKRKPRATSAVSTDSRPVTKAEAATVFHQARVVLAHALEASVPGKTRIQSNGSPVTREQVVSEFTQIFTSIRPSFKFTPNPLPFNSDVLKIGSSEKVHLQTLIRYGCVGKVSPLATGPTDSLTPQDFGDALGLFMARMAELTHMPTPKWSPILGAGS